MYCLFRAMNTHELTYTHSLLKETKFMESKAQFCPSVAQRALSFVFSNFDNPALHLTCLVKILIQWISAMTVGFDAVITVFKVAEHYF